MKFVFIVLKLSFLTGLATCKA